MKTLQLKPTIYEFPTVADFAAEFQLGKGDLVITNAYIYDPFFGDLNLGCEVICQEKYGMGEPSDEMVEAMCRDIKGDYKRIIAIGGGTIIDISKLFALDQVSPVLELYDGARTAKKSKELVLVPTTCGTGSEVTNIAILALNSRGTKKGLALEEMYADSAVLVPQLLSKLPAPVFATSSIDALIHAVESALSPNGNATTRLFSYKAITMILKGYKKLEAEGLDARQGYMSDFLLASCYAGIAFGNAGCAAVHALSYPLGAAYHVPHGESNYALFSGVMKNYMELKQDGEIAVLNRYIADLIGCKADEVYDALDKLLGLLIPKKALHEYGMTEQELDLFTDSVLENQTRLLKNNFVPLDRARIRKIYAELF
ncbi:MAG: 4-hydroxybutyrate dehydrogenase [Acidithiobacillus sp.]